MSSPKQRPPSSEVCHATDFTCENFPSDSSTSSKGAGDFICKKGKDATLGDEDKTEVPPECRVCSAMPTSSSSSSTISAIPAQDFDSPCRLIDRTCEGDGPPDLGYEMSIAKSIMQQYSTLSGNNLYDHLSDIIKRVIDERPPNVIDFFEEFSRNVREQKFYLPERFLPGAIHEPNRMYKMAKRQLMSMKLPYDQLELDPEHLEEDNPAQLNLDIEIADVPNKLFVVFTERVQQLQFFWNQCGFSTSTEDIFLLACALDRLQTHPSIMQCRFWGVINGLKASYYIVEASLTRDQVSKRVVQMEDELRERLQAQLQNERCQPEIPSHIGPELTPGFYGWEKCPPEELAKMTPLADPIPLARPEEVYDVPPEMIGAGLNRYSYFVVNSLSDEWLELPIVTPKQVVVSRQIKKFLTGDLEHEFCSYPCFPGKEKHYLRALIARITCGTTIAPRGFYRKMTKAERRMFEGSDDDEDELEEEEEDDHEGEEEEEDGPIDNDIMPLRNEKYEPPESLTELKMTGKWLHVRPYILKQGRVVWFDEEKARKEREKELARLRRLELTGGEEEGGLEDLEEEVEEEGGDEDEEFEDLQEYGPRIFTSCGEDTSDEFTVPWVARLSSQFTNKPERVIVMRSNVWPGAFTFAFDKTCESIYMGWGHKYSARNMAFHHLPPIVDEYTHTEDDFIEANDPTVAEEEEYRLWLLSKIKRDDGLGEEELWSPSGEQEEDEED